MNQQTWKMNDNVQIRWRVSVMMNPADHLVSGDALLSPRVYQSRSTPESSYLNSLARGVPVPNPREHLMTGCVFVSWTSELEPSPCHISPVCNSIRHKPQQLSYAFTLTCSINARESLKHTPERDRLYISDISRGIH